jgi:hypothetical protein
MIWLGMRPIFQGWNNYSQLSFHFPILPWYSKTLKQAEGGPQNPQGDLVKMAFKVFITEMRLETSERPSSWWLPWGCLLPLRDGPDNNAHIQGPASGATTQDIGQKLPFTSPATRTLSTMWPEWTLEDDCPSLSLQGRSVSHTHSQQSEGLTDLLDLAAEDGHSPGTLDPFKITSEEPRVTVQVADRPQSLTWLLG